MTRHARAAACRVLDHEAVVLAGDRDLAACARSITGWFAPWWPNLSLRGRPQRQPRDLVAQADAEHRHARPARGTASAPRPRRGRDRRARSRAPRPTGFSASTSAAGVCARAPRDARSPRAGTGAGCCASRRSRTPRTAARRSRPARSSTRRRAGPPYGSAQVTGPPARGPPARARRAFSTSRVGVEVVGRDHRAQLAGARGCGASARGCRRSETPTTPRSAQPVRQARLERQTQGARSARARPRPRRGSASTLEVLVGHAVVADAADR